ncbi:MAG: sigma-54-dependent Fis family transcriptional regulator [Acidobacteria bacterium]|nr:MAG: sigma-54-dependent Fis family transcriptional regulator [Acidobacteriota bacterium]
MNLEARVLVVEDDRAQREQLAGFLADLGAEVVEAADGREALDRVAEAPPDLVLTDLRMPRLDGHALLRELARRAPDLPVIVITAYGTVRDAVACLKDGASDYLLKPLDLDEVEIAVTRALEESRLRRENRDLRRRLGRIETPAGIVCAGGPMLDVLAQVERVARSHVNVVIHGESGTGKELVARAIHAASPRADGPFVAVNAAALPSTLLESELFGHEKGAFTGADRARTGRFEAASGGTLFLDEIGDLPADVQVKLLRVLQERVIERVGSTRPIPVDVRVIAATHQDLPALIGQGRFRADLYYRLAVVTIELPPLRRRRGDIPLLVEHFLDKHADLVDGPVPTFSREALDLLVRYDFPGNVRELENIVQRGLVLAEGDQITTAELPASVLGGARSEAGPGVGGTDDTEPRTLPERIAALERQAIAEALAAEGGNQSRAARRLGISERALRYKLARLRGERQDSSSEAP